MKPSEITLVDTLISLQKDGIVASLYVKDPVISVKVKQKQHKNDVVKLIKHYAKGKYRLTVGSVKIKVILETNLEDRSRHKEKRKEIRREKRRIKKHNKKIREKKLA